MANNHEWDTLEEYCAKDAQLTRDLILLPRIKIPIHTIHGANQTMEIEWDKDKFLWVIPKIVVKKKERKLHPRTMETISLFE